MKLELANLKFFAGAALAIVINPGCGGISANGDNPGGTGGTYNAETGGAGNGGSVSTGGQSGVDYGVCSSADTCSFQPIYCCGGCDSDPVSSFVAVSSAMMDQYQQTHAACPCVDIGSGCPAPDQNSMLNYVAICIQGHCQASAGGVNGTGGATSTVGFAAGGAAATGGQAAVGGAASCAQGATCTGLGQCTNSAGLTCQCNGGQYYCNGSLAAGGAAATGGTAGALSCAGVNCPALPDSCIDIVQDPNACCPTCTDTGCAPCADITCASGTHLETPVGACCPQCVLDPVDPCTQGQQNYAAMRATLLDKYASLGCHNSSDCVIVPEDNLCVANCGNPLPSTMAASFEANLTTAANSDCATCSTPVPPPCVSVVPACVNGKCTTANPS